MKKLLISLLISIAGVSSIFSKTVTDVYDLTLRLNVPQVLNNSTSQGYRKYKRQVIKGYLTITYDTTGESKPIIDVKGLVNKSFKIKDKHVSYESIVNDDSIISRLVLIGNNKTGLFKTPSTCFYLEAYPSYAITDLTEDNSFYLLFSGRGITTKINNYRIINKLTGYVTGTQGCSCGDYGHVSPTRTAGYLGATKEIEDVACVYGTWTAKRNKTCSRTVQIITR